MLKKIPVKIMAEEIQEAVQIIRVAYEGIEIAMKVGSGGIGAMQKAVEFLKGMLDYEKTLGRTSMKKLLMKGGDLQIFQFQSDEMKKVEKMAKKYGILYSVLPDMKKQDGLSEVIFHSEAVPRVNGMIQRMKFGKIITIDDYLQNGNKKGQGKLQGFFREQKPGNDKSLTGEDSRADEQIEGLIEQVGLFAIGKPGISANAVNEEFAIGKEQAEDVIRKLETIGVLDHGDADGLYKAIMDKEAFINRIRGYQDLEERIRAVSASKNLDLIDVAISRELLVKERETAIKTRVPGTFGQDARYIWIPKENILEINQRKTMLTFLDRTKQYKLYDEENRVVGTMKGEDLYSRHYDRVEPAVREQNKKSMKQEKAKVPEGQKFMKPQKTKSPETFKVEKGR
ncbi:PcfB family protein [Anaerobium acetethylicum]|uniref:PcfB family protein n=1 Tax=Anaerobium acetethylicum TaxID=1619234 RepID=A0A1D3TWJ4_9FIRM|nr:PcfB family protein [Anaerobium acetethylicum]SCP98632.1 Protein of unknown function [Anaerobium acetethylicum]